jgi:hypothetical protein
MTPNAYRGEIAFTLPIAEDGTTPGKTYLLRIGTYEFLRIQDRFTTLKGPPWLVLMLHTGLTAIAGQESLTEEDAALFLDLLGYDVVNDLINQTRFGKNLAKQAALAPPPAGEEPEAGGLPNGKAGEPYRAPDPFDPTIAASS